jgi:hypothetical protein
MFLSDFTEPQATRLSDLAKLTKFQSQTILSEQDISIIVIVIKICWVFFAL